MKVDRRVLAGHAAVLIGVWILAVFSVWKNRGLFDWLGVDYALYAAGARLMLSDDPRAVYDLDAVARTIAPYAAHYGPYADPLKVGPLPYPALAFLQYAPFAHLAPTAGYLLWAVANLLLAAWVVRGLAGRFPDGRGAITALGLAYFPLVYTLFVGQPVVVMLLALALAYRAWERGRDFEAGLWLGGLFLKVQYPMVLLLVLLYKKRWRSLAGVTVSGLAVFLSSLAVFGVRGLSAFLATLRAMSGFRDVHAIIYPHQMINWRGLLVNLLPAGTSEAQGKALTLALSALTATTLLAIWRGRWEPRGPRFAARILATLLVTMLTSFHNHIHGATLLLVPGMVLMAEGGGPRPLPWLLRAGLYLPPLVFALTYNPELVAFLFIGLMVAALVVIVRAEVAGEGPRSGLREGGPTIRAGRAARPSRVRP